MKKLLVIGVGLMAGSLAWAFKEKKLFSQVVGVDKSKSALKKAKEKGIIDTYSEELASSSKDVDMVIIGTPVGQMEEIIQRLGENLKEGAVVLDLGSTKRNVCRAARKLPDHVYFVGGHPMTGSELSGVGFANSELFVDRPFILTPLNEEGYNDKLEMIQDYLEKIGANTIIMDACEHDYIMASISHLPHFLAFILVECVILGEDRTMHKKLCAGGFKDSTRISMSDSRMWSEIFLKNKDNLKHWLEKFQEYSQELMEFIEKNEKEELINKLEKIKKARLELEEEALDLENGRDYEQQ